MPARQTHKPTKKAAPAGRNPPARRAAARPKAAPSTAAAARAKPARSSSNRPKTARPVTQTAARKLAAKPRVVTSGAKPASMTAPLPPIVTLKHLAEWAGYNNDVPKKQAIAMFIGFVEDIGRVLKKGSKIRIPNLGILQVRVRPARPARKGRNPATGEEIQINASRASKRVAFRAAKSLNEAI